jgi:hypothetical protein
LPVLCHHDGNALNYTASAAGTCAQLRVLRPSSRSKSSTTGIEPPDPIRRASLPQSFVNATRPKPGRMRPGPRERVQASRIFVGFWCQAADGRTPIRLISCYRRLATRLFLSASFRSVSYSPNRTGCRPYLLQPFCASANPSNKRPALSPASVSSRCGWPCSTV